MATTYTSRLRLAKQGLGENTDTWGTILNENTFDMVDESFGVVDKDCSAGGTITLTTNNGTVDESRASVINLSGSPGADYTVVFPNTDKFYHIRNITGQIATIETATPTASVTIISGEMATVYCDGAASFVKQNTSVATIANGTDGELITWDSDGAPTTVAVGNAGDVLTSAGAGAEPSFQTPASASPAGVVSLYAGSTEPSGWIFCGGQDVSRVTYSDLFAAIGTTYGIGDGSTTFGIPDLRGRVGVGRDDMVSDANRMTSGGAGIDGNTLGAAGGSETHQLTTSELASHTHASGSITATSDGSHNHQAGSSTSVAGGDTVPTTVRQPNQSGANTETAGAHTHSTTGTSASTGSDTAHQNTQPSIILNYIIKT
jgi:microcystin-dependent protein